MAHVIRTKGRIEIAFTGALWW